MGCTQTFRRGRALSGNGKLSGAKRGTEAALLGAHPRIREVREAIERVAPTTLTVLLSGEIGTGKGLAAAAIHAASARAHGPFVEVHCEALDEKSLDAELFGGEEPDSNGSAARVGRVRQADGGTLFLGDVADIPAGTQGRLLRFLEEQTLASAAGGRPIRVAVRLVAATHRDLREEVAAGRFREDLFYRLNIVQIEIPPLRERRIDIPLLAAELLARTARRHGRFIDGFTPESLELLQSHRWPGNVRELGNAIERAVVMARQRWIRPEDLRPALIRNSAVDLEVAIPGSTLAEIERVAILRTLAAVQGSTSRAAAMLGISTRKIQYRMREYREDGRLALRFPSNRAD
jgi:DNA-binding NtrC family response regulator